MKKLFKYLYVIVFVLISITPLTLLAIKHFANSTAEQNIEKTQQLAFPKLVTNDGINDSFGDECEIWLNQNLPYRGELLQKINVVLSDGLKTPTSNVVPGKDGWIYSTETIDDFMDVNAMTEEEVKALEVTLSLMQEKVESYNGKFLFVPVPNKNSIYPEYMPGRYYYASENNLTRVYAALEQTNVNYVNLKQDLLAAKEGNETNRIYYKRDTHWTTLGAIVGYKTMMRELGKSTDLAEGYDYAVEKTKCGDLDKLLYPVEERWDDECVVNKKIDINSFEFVNPVGVEDKQAQLENFMSDKEERDNDFTTKKVDSTDGSSLYMIRDSFARALLPYMIDSYDEARFVRSSAPSFENIPEGADVIYEICERNIRNIIRTTPMMYAPERAECSTVLYSSKNNTLICEDEGYAYKIYGTVDSNMVADDGRIFIRLTDNQGETKLLEAFPSYDNGWGFSAYIQKYVLEDGEFSASIVSGKYASDNLAKLPEDIVLPETESGDVEGEENIYDEENNNHRIVYHGVTFGIGDNINAIKDELGTQSEPMETIYSCLTGSDGQLYHYPNMSIETNMDGIIHYICIMGDQEVASNDIAATELGIALGSDKKDIWSLIGTPTKENDKYCYFQMQHMKVTYSYKGGKVTSIILEKSDGSNAADDSTGGTGESQVHEIQGIEYENGNTYLYNDAHELMTGWQIIDGEYYFFDRISGERIVGQSVDGIEIGDDGEVELSDYDKDKIEIMMKAHQVMLEITEPTDTMEEKRKKAFDWVITFPYHRYRKLKDCYHQEGIEIVMANDIFEEGAGDCASEAAAFAFLIHEMGYNNVYWVHDTGHSWVRSDDKLYDPLFAESEDYDANYDAPFTDYRVTMAHSLFIY